MNLNYVQSHGWPLLASNNHCQVISGVYHRAHKHLDRPKTNTWAEKKAFTFSLRWLIFVNSWLQWWCFTSTSGCSDDVLHQQVAVVMMLYISKCLQWWCFRDNRDLTLSFIISFMLSSILGFFKLLSIMLNGADCLKVPLWSNPG